MYQPKTDTLHNALVPYLWSHSISWCLTDGYEKQRSVPRYGPMWLGKDLTFSTTDDVECTKGLQKLWGQPEQEILQAECPVAPYTVSTLSK